MLFIYHLLISFTLLTSLEGREYLIEPTLTEFENIQTREAESFRFDGNLPKLFKVNYAVPSRGAAFHFGGKLPQLSTINLRGNSGPLTVTLNGEMPILSHSEFSSTSGDITIDLQSPLANPSRIIVKATSGNIHITLSPQVFAHVDIRTSSGKINVRGLQKSIWDWFHQSYNSCKYSDSNCINIEVETTSGDVFINQ